MASSSFFTGNLVLWSPGTDREAGILQFAAKFIIRGYLEEVFLEPEGKEHLGINAQRHRY
jgi:hypothetical protein